MHWVCGALHPAGDDWQNTRVDGWQYQRQNATLQNISPGFSGDVGKMVDVVLYLNDGSL